MDYLAAMNFFVRSVDLGSFSKAAEHEGVKVSTVSRHVNALEADLGAALLSRSTRRLHLTEAGATFYERAARILAEVEEARTTTASLNAKPQGLLRINVPSSFGRRHIIPHLHEFLAEFPDIRVEATLTDATVDLIETGTDIAVRIGAPVDSTLVARRLASHRRIAVASPKYLARRPTPGEPADLAGHDCLHHVLEPSRAWYFRPRGNPAAALQQVEVRGPLSSTDSEALLTAVLAGLGIALLANWLVGEDLRAGRLVQVLPAWDGLIAPGPERAIWGVYPPSKVVSPKVKAFLGFLIHRFGNPPYWELGNTPAVSAAPLAGELG